MKRKHRQWSIAEKRRIVAEAIQPGTNKAALARRYGISESRLYAWRKALGNETHARFLPVISDEASAGNNDQSSGSIDIVLANGHRLTVSSAVDSAHVDRLVRALAST